MSSEHSIGHIVGRLCPLTMAGREEPQRGALLNNYMI